MSRAYDDDTYRDTTQDETKEIVKKVGGGVQSTP